MVAPSDPISYTGNVGEPLVIPCDKPKSIPEAFVSWSLVEDEYDHMPDSVTLSDRVTMDEYGTNRSLIHTEILTHKQLETKWCVIDIAMF